MPSLGGLGLGLGMGLPVATRLRGFSGAREVSGKGLRALGSLCTTLILLAGVCMRSLVLECLLRKLLLSPCLSLSAVASISEDSAKVLN